MYGLSEIHIELRFPHLSLLNLATPPQSPFVSLCVLSALFPSHIRAKLVTSIIYELLLYAKMVLKHFLCIDSFHLHNDPTGQYYCSSTVLLTAIHYLKSFCESGMQEGLAGLFPLGAFPEAAVKM